MHQGAILDKARMHRGAILTVQGSLSRGAILAVQGSLSRGAILGLDNIGWSDVTSYMHASLFKAAKFMQFFFISVSLEYSQRDSINANTAMSNADTFDHHLKLFFIYLFKQNR